MICESFEKNGIVKDIKDGKALILIKMCESCHANGRCGMSEKDKIIEIKINNEEKEEKFKRFMKDIQKRPIENLRNYIFNIKEYNGLL